MKCSGTEILEGASEFVKMLVAGVVVPDTRSAGSSHVFRRIKQVDAVDIRWWALRSSGEIGPNGVDTPPEFDADNQTATDVCTGLGQMSMALERFLNVQMGRSFGDVGLVFAHVSVSPCHLRRSSMRLAPFETEFAQS